MRAHEPHKDAPLSLFLERNGLTDRSAVVDVFHAVRRIPYGVGFGRSVEQVVRRGVGSCSGKHLLLRDVLRRLSHAAAVETARGDFTSRLSPCKGMPDELQRMCREGDVQDFHHYVVWDGPDGEVTLDATWSDAPIGRGVPGNQAWTGRGDTHLALVPNAVLDRAEDVPAYKETLLAGMRPEVRRRRRRFFDMLTAWTTRIEAEARAEPEGGGRR